LTEWEWYTDVPTKTLFIHLLLTANHKPGKWQGIDVPVGATITSIRKLATETGLSIQQVRTAIKHLISTHDLTQSSTAKYTVFKLENYDSYQESNTESNTPPTHCQHTANTLLTTNKNNKNNKNEKKERSIYSAEGAVDASFQTSEAREAMKAYLQMRESMKKPVKTERAYKLLIGKLHKLAQTETEMVPIIDQSIERNWMSFFELKEDRQKVQPNQLPDHPFFREI
ncbi:hypothetical protein, partial [Faecalibaculum rodentium]|uniref:hypothetical protein n=1 Tax=Faecalibaculum rodentium TaxID=1702221 RepID=UPI003F66DA03